MEVEEYGGIIEVKGEGVVEESIAALRPKRDNNADAQTGASDNKRARSGKKHKDTDVSLAALNLQQPFNVPQYRFTPVVPHSAVTLSLFDRAPQLRLTKDALTASGHKGYRLIRGTHGVSQGAWYCEATVLEDYVDEGLEERWAHPATSQAASVVPLLRLLPVCVAAEFTLADAGSCLGLCRFLNEKGHCRLGWARSSAHIQVGLFFQHMAHTVRHVPDVRRPAVTCWCRQVWVLHDNQGRQYCARAKTKKLHVARWGGGYCHWLLHLSA